MQEPSTHDLRSDMDRGLLCGAKGTLDATGPITALVKRTPIEQQSSKRLKQFFTLMAETFDY